MVSDHFTSLGRGEGRGGRGGEKVRIGIGGRSGDDGDRDGGWR